MENETFECSFKRAFEKDDGGVTVYVTKDDGTDMTIYGEAIGTSRWQKGARLKIAAQPVRTSKSGKQYQTASMIELLSGEVGNDVNFDQIDGYVRKILNAQYDGDEAPF